MSQQRFALLRRGLVAALAAGCTANVGSTEAVAPSSLVLTPHVLDWFGILPGPTYDPFESRLPRRGCVSSAAYPAILRGWATEIPENATLRAASPSIDETTSK